MKFNKVSHFKTALFGLALLASPGRAVAVVGEPVAPWPNENSPALRPATTSATDTVRSPNMDSQTSTPRYNEEMPPDRGNNLMTQVLGILLGGGPVGTAATGISTFGLDPYTTPGGNQFPEESFPGMPQRRGSGEMEACGEVSTSVRAALAEAQTFRSQCSLADRGSNQKLAINDYSGEGTPHIYIFDLDGNCLGRTAVSYGNGAGRVKPQPCNEANSHLTPAGFHLTSVHNGARYGSAESVGLVGLEGQNSTGRGVIIHAARSPGTASSWGCSGVGFSAFEAVKATLGEGSLVYNFFGNASGPSSCNNRSGLTGQHSAACRLDSGGSSVPPYSTAGGAPVTR